MVTRSSGYTLVELMVVLAVIGALSLLMFYGISSFQNGQAVKNAQLKFVSDLRLLQTKVRSGADGDLFKEVEIAQQSSSYKLDGDVVFLPKNVKISFDSNNLKLWLCFANPNFLDSYSEGYLSSGPQSNCGKTVCAVTSSGIYFACMQTGGPPAEIDSGTVTVRFSNGVVNEDVSIDGEGMNINTINAQ